jgi:hypothetical protein
MQHASEEQTWWSNLFTDGADPALEMSTGIWESVIASTFEMDTPSPTDDLLPADDIDFGFEELSEETHTDHDVCDTGAHIHEFFDTSDADDFGIANDSDIDGAYDVDDEL